MVSFGWKQQNNTSKRKKTNTIFHGTEDDDDEPVDDAVDWLTASKKSKVFVLEDSVSKAKRLKEEGVLMASNERWWSAIGKWNASVKLHCNDHTVHEMLAQAYMQVGEVFPAVRAAQKCVELSPTWWIGHQTLGRAQLGLGEVVLAVKSFSRAIHINPTDIDLWEQDLKWAVSLLEKHKDVTKNSEANKDTDDEFTLKEVDDEEAQEFMSSLNSADKSEGPAIVSKRYMSKVLKQIPKFSDVPKVTTSTLSNVDKAKILSDVSSLVKLRVNR